MLKLREIRIALTLTFFSGLLMFFGALLHHLALLGRVEVEYEKGKVLFQTPPRKPGIVAILCAWMRPELSRVDLAFAVVGFLIVCASLVALCIAYSGSQEKRKIFLTITAISILSNFYILKIWLRNSGFYPTYTAPYYTCLVFGILGLVAFIVASRGLNIHVANAEVGKVLIYCGLICAVVAVPASRWGFVRQPFRSIHQLEYQHDVVSLGFTIGFFVASLFLCLAGAAVLAGSHFFGTSRNTETLIVHKNVVQVDGY